MDTLSHALWGYALTRWRGPRTARWGALAGAAPDLTYTAASIVDTLINEGLEGLRRGGEASQGNIWVKDGPPQPPELIRIYETYYVWTHSLVVVGLLALLWYLLRRRQPWVLLPAALHILMDIPSHERWQTQFLYPLSDFNVTGISWGRPPMLVANFAGLAIVYFMLYRRYWSKERPGAQEPWPEQVDGVA